MEVRLIENLNINEFFNPLQSISQTLNDASDKFLDWSNREKLIKNILKVINDNSNYKALSKKNDIYILPNDKHLVKVHFTFNDDKTIDVKAVNYKNDTLEKKFDFSSDDASDKAVRYNDMLAKFEFSEKFLDEVYDMIDKLILKVRPDIINEANIFTSIISKIGNKISDLKGKQEINKSFIKDIIEQLRLPAGLTGNSYDIDLDNNKYTISIDRDKGSNFILAFSLEPDPDNHSKLALGSLLGCRDDDRVNLRKSKKDVQSILDIIASKLGLPSNSFRLSDKTQEETGSSKEDVLNRKPKEDSFDSSSTEVSPIVAKILSLDENLLEFYKPEDYINIASKLLNGKNPDTDEDIKLTIGDKRAIIKYFLKNSIENFKEDSVNDNVLDLIYNYILSKFKLNPFKNPFIDFIIKFLSKDSNKLNSTIIKVLTENENSYKFITDKIINQLIDSVIFWDNFKDLDSDEIYTYLNYILNNLISYTEDKNKGILSKLNLKIKDDEARELLKNTYLIKPSKDDSLTLKDLLIYDKNKFRDLQTIKDIVKLLKRDNVKDSVEDDIDSDNSEIEVDDSEVTLNNYFKDIKENPDKDLYWEDIDNLLKDAFKVDIKKIHNENKSEYEDLVKSLGKILFNVDPKFLEN